MTAHKADIVIFGAGIAGLWVFNRLKREGYDVLLLEQDAIGGGQSIASQGIIHSGLKYTLGGKVNKLAKSISAMPDVWRESLTKELAAAKANAGSQCLLVPDGFMSGLARLAVRPLAPGEWPESLAQGGFKGSVINMSEPVLDIPSVVRALAEPYRDSIRKHDGNTKIEAQLYIHTAAGGNEALARQSGHGQFETQRRPLLMVMMRGAPFDLYAHMVGASDKPVATITTHYAEDGERVWYIGGSVAERAKESDPFEAYDASRAAIEKYLPRADLSRAQWAALPIDRVEGKVKGKGFMPDTPTLHAEGNALYAWPTKLTFAPMLSDMIADKIKAGGITPSGQKGDWSFLPAAEYAKTPWDRAEWTSLQKERSAKRV